MALVRYKKRTTEIELSRTLTSRVTGSPVRNLSLPKGGGADGGKWKSIHHFQSERLETDRFGSFLLNTAELR